MKKEYLYPAVIAFLVGFSAISYAECSKEDVIFYLQEGFSHEQVVGLCATSKKSTSTPYDSLTTKKFVPKTGMKKSIPAGIDNIIYLKSTIQADELQLTSTQLNFTENSHCIQYGLEDGTGFKDEVCVMTKTVIDLAGLKIIKAKKGLPLFGGSELIISGKIQRQVLNPDILNTKQRLGIKDSYQLNPLKLHIPMRSGIDPVQLAAKLKSIAKE